MELHFKYFDKLRVIDAQLQRNVSDEDDQDEIYLKRLEGGLFTLQLVDYIMMEVCASGAASIKQRVLHTLNLRGGTVKTIREIMRGEFFRNHDSIYSGSRFYGLKLFFFRTEYAGNLGDGSESEAKEEEKQHILQLLDKF